MAGQAPVDSRWDELSEGPSGVIGRAPGALHALMPIVVAVGLTACGGRAITASGVSSESGRHRILEPADGALVAAPRLTVIGAAPAYIMPVEPLTPATDRRAPQVSDGPRPMPRPQARLYSISGYGGDVERLLQVDTPAGRSSARKYS